MIEKTNTENEVNVEDIVALYNNGVIHLDAIDDLMSYRYFISVNNPIVLKIGITRVGDYSVKDISGIYED